MWIALRRRNLMITVTDWSPHPWSSRLKVVLQAVPGGRGTGCLLRWAPQDAAPHLSLALGLLSSLVSLEFSAAADTSRGKFRGKQTPRGTTPRLLHWAGYCISDFNLARSWAGWLPSPQPVLLPLQGGEKEPRTLWKVSCSSGSTEDVVTILWHSTLSSHCTNNN